MKKIIFHIDIDAFFAQCHVLENPDKYSNKPLVVCRPSSKSIITSCTYEARKFNIKAGMPLFQAKAICPSLITIEPNHFLYEKASMNFFKFFKGKFSNLPLEVGSIDEVYIDVTKLVKKIRVVKKTAIYLQNQILKYTKLSCSIGCSYNKFLAKTASNIKKPFGITIINKSNFKDFIWNKPISEMHGVGPSLSKSLIKYNIKTIEDLANCDHYNFKINNNNRNLTSLIACAKGQSSDEINIRFNKSISKQTSLNSKKNNYNELFKYLNNNFNQLYQLLISKNYLTKTVEVMISDKKNKKISKQISLSSYTNKFDILYEEIIKCFDILWNIKIGYVFLIGISFKQIINEYNYLEQSNINNFEKNKIFNKSKFIIDNINRKKKKNILFKYFNIN